MAISDLPAPPVTAPPVTDRHRPSRIGYRIPAFIAPLHQLARTRNDAIRESTNDPTPRPARGILIGLLLVTPFWGVVATCVWLAVRH